MFTSEANTTDLDLIDDEKSNGVVTAVMMMTKTAQTIEITMKRNLTPIDLKTFFSRIVMMS